MIRIKLDLLYGNSYLLCDNRLNNMFNTCPWNIIGDPCGGIYVRISFGHTCDSMMSTCSWRSACGLCVGTL